MLIKTVRGEESQSGSFQNEEIGRIHLLTVQLCMHSNISKLCFEGLNDLEYLKDFTSNFNSLSGFVIVRFVSPLSFLSFHSNLTSLEFRFHAYNFSTTYQRPLLPTS